jgi:hypothetical protein
MSGFSFKLEHRTATPTDADPAMSVVVWVNEPRGRRGAWKTSGGFAACLTSAGLS